MRILNCRLHSDDASPEFELSDFMLWEDVIGIRSVTYCGGATTHISTSKEMAMHLAVHISPSSLVVVNHVVG